MREDVNDVAPSVEPAQQNWCDEGRCGCEALSFKWYEKAETLFCVDAVLVKLKRLSPYKE